jgi:4-hydroxybenzoate polyprenyltransferase
MRVNQSDLLVLTWVGIVFIGLSFAMFLAGVSNHETTSNYLLFSLVYTMAMYAQYLQKKEHPAAHYAVRVTQIAGGVALLFMLLRWLI